MNQATFLFQKKELIIEEYIRETDNWLKAIYIEDNAEKLISFEAGVQRSDKATNCKVERKAMHALMYKRVINHCKISNRFEYYWCFD